MRRSTALLLFFLIMVGISTWYFIEHWRSSQEIETTLQALQQRLAAGDLAAAQQYLVNHKEPTHPTFSSLSVLAEAGAIRWQPTVQTGWLAPFGRTRATMPLTLPGNQTESLSFRLSKTAQGWKVSGLPKVLAHPAALLTRISDREGRLLIDGQEMMVGLIPQDRPQVGFAVVLNDRLRHFEPAVVTPLAKLLRVVPGKVLETEGEALRPLASNAALYNLANPARPPMLSRLIPGSEGLAAVIWQSKVYGVVQLQPWSPEKVRVVLGTTDFRGLEHQEVKASSALGLDIVDPLGKTSGRLPSGAVATFRRQGEGIAAFDASGKELVRSSTRLIVRPTGTASSVLVPRVTIASISRGTGAGFAPSYRGQLEVAPTSAGAGLNLINELPLNEYLYSVVPSEMPISFGLEALKVQALAARAYAVSGILGSGYAAYGAHVDDSVSSQVYNNVPEQAISTQAVNDTGALIPTYQGQVVDARFFSTSSGYTASAHEVWSAGDQFPGPVVPYLVAKPQAPAIGILANDAAMANFLSSRDISAPDADSPFFRWAIAMTREELEASIRANLVDRQKAQPMFVLTRDAQGAFVSQTITGADPIGTLQDIKVAQRAEGGNIMALDLIGSKGTYRIIKEYNIRFTVRPVQYLSGRSGVALKLQDGSVRENYSILPSAFAVFDLERDGTGAIQRVTIRGGGNGHGAGMSQYGAAGLAKRGMSFEQIIQHYYPGSKVEELSAVFK